VFSSSKLTNGMLHIVKQLSVKEAELQFTAIAPSNPANQPGIELSFTLRNSLSLPVKIRQHLAEILQSKLNPQGKLIISVNTHHTEAENKQEAIKQLMGLLHDALSSNDCEIVIITAATLQNLKHAQHNRLVKTYYLVKNRIGKIAVYVIDKGRENWLRKIVVDEKFTANLINLDSHFVSRINHVKDDNDALTETNLNSTLGARKKHILARLIMAYEKVDFLFCQSLLQKKEKMAVLVKDSYILTRSKKDVFQLDYYIAAKKINIPLLNYQKDGLYSILTSLTTPDVCISPEGLESFALSLHYSNRKDVLHYQLKLHHTAPAELNLYQQSKVVVQNITTKLEELCKKMLDEKSYQTYFVDSKKDAIGRFIIPEQAEMTNMMVRYQHYINLLINLQIFFEKTGATHSLVFQAKNTIDLVKSSPWLYSAYSDWAISYSDLYEGMIKLDAISYIQNIASASGMVAEVSKLIPVSKDSVMEKIQANPFYLTYTNNQNSWKNLLQGTASKLIALQKILNDLNLKLPKGGEANVTIQRTISDLNLVLNAWTRFNNSRQKTLDMIRLAMTVYPKISTLIRDIPQSMVSLGSEFKDYFLLTAQQINLIFRDLIVALNEFEIHYHLKKGILLSSTFADLLGMIGTASGAFSSFLKDVPKSFIAIGSILRSQFFVMVNQVVTVVEESLKKNKLNHLSLSMDDSLRSLIIRFNLIVENNGYQFLENERYPYNKTVLASLKAMLATEQASNPRLLERIEELEDIIEQHKAKLERDNTRHFYQKLRVNKYQAAIRNRINDLTAYQRSYVWCVYPGVRDEKIRLLEELSVKVAATPSLHDALDTMAKTSIGLRQQIHLLWQGRTGEMLRNLLLESQVANDSILDAITVEIDRLKTARSKRKIWFEKARIKSIEDKITALQKFKKSLQKPGYLLRTALHEMNAIHPQDYNVLETQLKSLLAQLRELDSHIPKARERKKPVDFFSVEPARPDYSEGEIQYLYGYALQEITDQIKFLNSEIDAGHYFAAVKRDKIALLTQLHDKLTTRDTLEEVLAEIESDARFKNIYYLLHEGRTGIVLTHITHALATTRDLMAYFDTQILRLRSLRPVQYSIFDRQLFVEQRMFAINRLKQLIQLNPELSLDEVFSRLSSRNCHVLENYEMDVIQTLHDWYTAKTGLNLYRDNLPEEEEELQLIAIDVINPPSQALSPVKHDVHEDNFYAGIIENMQSMEKTIAKIFVEILDPVIYAQFFEKAGKDEQGKYDVISNENEPYWVHYYKHFFNFLISLRNCVEQIAQMHVPLIVYNKNKNWLQLMKSASVGIWGMMNVYKILYLNLEELDVFPFLQKLTSSDEIKKMLYGMVPENALRIKDTMVRSSLGLQSHVANLDVNQLGLNNALDTIERALVNAHHEDSMIVIAPVTQSVIKDVINMVKEIRRFAASPGGIIAIIKLLYRLYPHLIHISNNYEEAIACTSILIKNHLMKNLYQVNLIFSDVMAGLDKFKLDSFLTDVGPGELRTYEFKQGISINIICETFNSLIDNIGFKFKPEETYPYNRLLEQKRNHFHFALFVPASMPAQKIQDMHSLVLLQEDEELLARNMKDAESKIEKSEKMNKLIEQRIAQLEDEATRWYNFTSTKTIKIKLLTELKVQLTDKSLDAALVDMRQHLAPSLNQYISYLFEGRTGKVIETIQHMECTPQGVQDILSREIARLSAESYQFFFFESNRTRLLKSIEGLKHLKETLGEGGYRIGAALTELLGTHPEEYKAVKATETKLLATLKDIDQYIPDHVIGKIIIKSAAGARLH
jgi:ribosome-associated protein